jgi:hypothetical protein
MKANPAHTRMLAIVGQGPRLNRLAFARTGDANEGNMLVHGVISRALDDDRLPSTVQGLDAALAAAIEFATEQRISAGA